MAPSNLSEQLTKYLTDAHSIEQQALAQLRTAPDLAGDDEIAAAFSRHLAETEEHERLVRARLNARGATPATLKDLAGTLTGKGFTIFARLQPDTPGKLLAHAFSYEHMELAAYDLLGAVAVRASDEETAAVARRIEEEERAMAGRLAGMFDRAVAASLGELARRDLGALLDRYLSDAHALEAQAKTLLRRSPKLAGDSDLATAYRDHLAETEQHQRLIAARLEVRGASPSAVKDAALRLGALNWGVFFAAQPDTPAKLVAFSYAFEHLEMACYELLARVAHLAADNESETVARRILEEEQAAAERIHGLFEPALEASLRKQGVRA
jgi:ferritin-like metal-binding protein YciE